MGKYSLVLFLAGILSLTGCNGKTFRSASSGEVASKSGGDVNDGDISGATTSGTDETGAIGNMVANLGRINQEGAPQPGAQYCEPSPLMPGSPEEKTFNVGEGIPRMYNNDAREEQMVKNAMKQVPENNVSHAAIKEAYAKYKDLKAKGQLKDSSITVVDCGKRSQTARGLTIDFRTGQAYLVRHAYGSGTSPNPGGYAEGNQPFHVAALARRGSNGKIIPDHKTLLGFMKVSSVAGYSGSLPNGLDLIGIEKNLNETAEEKAVRFHSDKGKAYMSNGSSGRSFGCNVVAGYWGNGVQKAMAGGLLYNYHPKIEEYRSRYRVTPLA